MTAVAVFSSLQPRLLRLSSEPLSPSRLAVATSCRPLMPSLLLRGPSVSGGWCVPAAYMTAPVSGPEEIPVTDLSAPTTDPPPLPPPAAVSWPVLWSSLARFKLRLAMALVSLFGCTACSLSMPIFSGMFFEVLVGRRSEPLWTLLSKISVLYVLEPIFTVVFVINMTTVWEKVMTSLRGQIFRRILIQKSNSFLRLMVCPRLILTPTKA